MTYNANLREHSQSWEKKGGSAQIYRSKEDKIIILLICERLYDIN